MRGSTLQSLFIRRENCPVCSSKSFETICRILQDDPKYLEFLALEPTFCDSFWGDVQEGILKGQVFEVAKCRSCHFLYQTNILSDAGMELLYTKWIDKRALTLHKSKQDTESSLKTFDRTLAFISSYKKRTGDRQFSILDFGAGVGDFCLFAKSQGHVVYAYELSEERKRELSDKSIVCLSKEHMRERKFDIVVLDQVLEHVARPAQVLSIIYDLLEEDGVLYVATPNCKTVESLLRKGQLTHRTFQQLSPQHINAFTNTTLRTLLKRQKFRVINSPLSHIRSLSRKNIIDVAKRAIKPYYIHFASTALFCVKLPDFS